MPYSEFPKFQQLMAQESAQIFDATLIDVTLPLVPGLVERLECRHRRRGRRLRHGPRDQPDGEGVPEEPLHGLRLLGGGHRGGQGGGEGDGA